MRWPDKLPRPRAPDGLRQALLRARLRLRGRRVWFAAGARIDSYADLADGVSLGARSSVFGCRVGRWTYLGDGSLAIYSEIGAFCSVAPHAIIGGGRHPTGFVSTSPLFYGAVLNPWGPVEGAMDRGDELPLTVVGSDVWIGYSAVILPGVRVGDGAVVGAGAVVTRDVAPYEVVAGVPARTVRMRFGGADVDWLLAARWWEWPDERLRSLRPRFLDVASLRAAVEPASEPMEVSP